MFKSFCLLRPQELQPFSRMLVMLRMPPPTGGKPTIAGTR